MRPCHTSHPPAPQRGGEPAHADPALAHAMAGAGGLAAALSDIMRCRQPRLAAAAPSVLRRCYDVLEASRRGLGAAKPPLPAP